MLIDTREFCTGRYPNAEYPCECCGDWTTRYVMFDSGRATVKLCDTHRTLEHARRVLSEKGWELQV